MSVRLQFGWVIVHNLVIADDDVRKGSKKVAIEVEGIDIFTSLMAEQVIKPDGKMPPSSVGVRRLIARMHGCAKSKFESDDFISAHNVDCDRLHGRCVSCTSSHVKPWLRVL